MEISITKMDYLKSKYLGSQGLLLELKCLCYQTRDLIKQRHLSLCHFSKHQALVIRAVSIKWKKSIWMYITTCYAFPISANPWEIWRDQMHGAFSFWCLAFLFFLLLLFLIRSTFLFDCSFKGYSLPSGTHNGPRGTCVPRKAKSYIL